MSSVRDLLQLASSLEGDEARREAEVLLCHCLERNRAWLYTWPEAEVDPAVEQRFRDLLARRAQGEPVAYLTGERDFWSLSLSVSPATLIPRADTETLVAWALELPLQAEARVLDLGTGSGAIALALAHERQLWQLSASDASAEALALAARNVERYCPGRVRLLQGDWFEPVEGERFDLVASNPPYIECADPHLSRGDLRFEPETALASGGDGLADIRRIIAGAPACLAEGGYLLLEHGYQQAGAVRELLQAAGFQALETRRDLAGHERISGARWDA